MNPIFVLFVQFYLSLLAFALVAWWYVVPALRARPFAAAVTPLLIMHSFRHFGLFYVTRAAVASPPPDAFALPTAYGDIATAALALVALVAVRKLRPLSVPLVWLFNLVGFVDLGLASLNAQSVGLVNYHIGVAYLLPVFVVPALLVTHVLVFWLLLRRAPALAPAPSPAV